MAFELIPLEPEQHTLTFVPRLSLELPFFNLTFRKKQTPTVIKYSGRDAEDRPLRWEVYQDTSDDIGPPAVEAHEVWYLLVKPSIDSQRRLDGTIPEIVPLGGIRDCLRKVGWTAGGFQARELIKALTQIAFAGCVADLWVPTGDIGKDGKQRFLQIKGRFSRMSVYAIGEHHLTEEELTQSSFDFDLEDVVYVKLDPLEAKLQQLQDRRILDNQYLFSLNPAGRRWYELMAAKIFGVVKNNGSFCEIRYSWYVKHHHTLKRYFEHKRVRFQMDRVIRDHLESGYITKAEYRALKEPNEEIDYIIRYYPGPAAAESNSRIQTYIRQRKNLKKLRSHPQWVKNKIAPVQTVALSTITARHHDLAYELISKFRLNALTACSLVIAHEESVTKQLEAWPFRETKPRNPAGWIIQAIERNYDIPASYYEHKRREDQKQQRRLIQQAIAACSFCDSLGYRHFQNDKNFHRTTRLCTHNPTIESRIPLNAQNGPKNASEISDVANIPK